MAARKPTRKPTANKPRPIDALNRVVIPAEIREALGLESGDYVVFAVEGKSARLTPVAWKERS